MPRLIAAPAEAILAHLGRLLCGEAMSAGKCAWYSMDSVSKHSPGHLTWRQLVDHVMGRVKFAAWYARLGSQRDVRLLVEAENVTAARQSCTKALGVAEFPLEGNSNVPNNSRPTCRSAALCTQQNCRSIAGHCCRPAHLMEPDEAQNQRGWSHGSNRSDTTFFDASLDRVADPSATQPIDGFQPGDMQQVGQCKPAWRAVAKLRLHACTIPKTYLYRIYHNVVFNFSSWVRC